MTGPDPLTASQVLDGAGQLLAGQPEQQLEWVCSACGGTQVRMTQPETTSVSVELPAKVTTETEVVASPETDGDPAPDAATEAMEAEPAE